MFGFTGSSETPLHEFWHEYTPQEIRRVKRMKCRDCPYKGAFSSSGGDGTTMCCDYLLITGESRDCRPEMCTHYLDKGVDRQNAFKSYQPIRKEQVYV